MGMATPVCSLLGSSSPVTLLSRSSPGPETASFQSLFQSPHPGVPASDSDGGACSWLEGPEKERWLEGSSRLRWGGPGWLS